MITDFVFPKNRKAVSWRHDGKEIAFHFEYMAFAMHIEYLNEVLIVTDVSEDGRNNLAIYHADGSLKKRPEMPERKCKVAGVYTIWFYQDRQEQTLVLISDEFNPYQTACTFNLETYEFSNFHPTK